MMGWLSFFNREKREAGEPTEQRSAFDFGPGFFNWNTPRRSPAVGADGVLSNLAVAARCVALRSEVLASVPIRLYRRTDDGGRAEILDHPVAEVLREPNPQQSSYETREMLVRNLDLYGNGFGRVQRSTRGEVEALWPVSALWVTVERLFNRRIRYRISEPDMPGIVLLDEAGEIVHARAASTDGIIGRSPLQVARGAVALAVATSDTADALMRNSLRPSAVLQHPGKLSDKAFQNLQHSWKETNAGPYNAGNPLILEEGMKAEPLAFSPHDAQFLENRRLSNEDVARIFGVPPAVIGIGDRPTYGSAIEESRQLVQNCIAPLAARVEDAMGRGLLTRGERRAGLFIRFDLEGLLRGAMKDRFDAYRTGRDGGFLSADDIRRMENLPPLPAGGGEYWRPLNMTLAGAPVPVREATRSGPAE